MKTTKYSVISLIGIANGATGPLPVTSGTSTFPKYPSVTAPVTTTDYNANGAMLAAYTKNGANVVGPYRAYRNDLIVFPTQTVATQNTVTTAKAGTRSFYAMTAAHLDAFGAPLAASSGAVDGTYWTVCKSGSITTVLQCNNGVGYAGSADTPIAHRILMRVGVSTAFTGYGGGTSDAFAWNEDLVLAALYHSTWGGATPVTDGTKWCSDYKEEVPGDGTAKVVKASNGLMGKSKCSWQLYAAGTKGPAIKLNKADYVNFLFSWTEWISTTGLGTNAVLSGPIAANYHIGDYGTTEATYLNPVKTVADAGTSWSASAITFAYDETDPSSRVPGSIGDAVYFTRANGPFKST